MDSTYIASMHPVLLALLSAALFGAATPASKALLAGLSPYQLAGLLYLGAALGVLPVVIFDQRGKSLARMGKRNWIRLGGALLFGGALGPVFLMFGLTLASSASVALWLNLELVATAMLGVLFFRDHLGKHGWMGAAGVVLSAVQLSAGEGGLSGIVAALLVAAACLCWGLDNQFTALIDGITPSQSTLLKGAVAGSINLGIGVVLQPFLAMAGTTAAALGVGVFSYGASIALYISSAQQLGATRAQMIFASAPFWGVLLSAVALEETISLIQMLSAVMLGVSLVFLYRDAHSHEHRHEALAHRHMHRHDDGHHNHTHSDLDPSVQHSHWHEHESLIHTHPHWPDIHHRHQHTNQK